MDKINLRQQIEQEEHFRLAPNACFSDQSKGREYPEQPCALRTCFQRDVDRITYSKAFRRLKHKTQVFLQPEGDHYRTRLSHTLEVSRIARTIARALRLNEDLTEAIALGHDLGHTPFGHAGEAALNELVPGGFTHYSQSRRVVELLENDGKGLNLCLEVRDGIACHSGKKKAFTLEGRIVHWADRIGYISHDIDDAIRAGIMKESDIPQNLHQILGETHSRRIDTLVRDLIQNSGDEIRMSDVVGNAMMELREFMFENVYRNPVAKGEESKAKEILKAIYSYYVEHTAELPNDYMVRLYQDGIERAVCDYVAGMTDRYAVMKYEELFVPKGWQRI